MSNVASLVPTKSDKEIADNIRSELIAAYKPIVEILTDAKKAGFDVMISTGADGFMQVHLMEIKIVKNF